MLSVNKGFAPTSRSNLTEETIRQAHALCSGREPRTKLLFGSEKNPVQLQFGICNSPQFGSGTWVAQTVPQSYGAGDTFGSGNSIQFGWCWRHHWVWQFSTHQRVHVRRSARFISILQYDENMCMAEATFLKFHCPKTRPSVRQSRP